MTSTSSITPAIPHRSSTIAVTASVEPNPTVTGTVVVTGFPTFGFTSRVAVTENFPFTTPFSSSPLFTSSTSTENVPVGAIAGGTIAGLIVLAAVLLYVRRRRNNRLLTLLRDDTRRVDLEINAYRIEAAPSRQSNTNLFSERPHDSPSPLYFSHEPAPHRKGGMAGLNRGSSTVSSMAASAGSGPRSDSKAGTYAAASVVRQRELAPQVREIQQIGPHLQTQGGGMSVAVPSGDGGGGEAALQAQVSALQAEVERQQVQVEQMRRELDDVSPPEYLR